MSNNIFTFGQNVGILRQIDLRMPKTVCTFLLRYVQYISTDDLEFPTDYNIWIIAEMFWLILKTLFRWHVVFENSDFSWLLVWSVSQFAFTRCTNVAEEVHQDSLQVDQVWVWLKWNGLE